MNGDFQIRFDDEELFFSTSHLASCTSFQMRVDFKNFLDLPPDGKSFAPLTIRLLCKGRCKSVLQSCFEMLDDDAEEGEISSGEEKDYVSICFIFSLLYNF